MRELPFTQGNKLCVWREWRLLVALLDAHWNTVMVQLHATHRAKHLILHMLRVCEVNSRLDCVIDFEARVVWAHYRHLRQTSIHHNVALLSHRG